MNGDEGYMLVSPDAFSVDQYGIFTKCEASSAVRNVNYCRDFHPSSLFN